MLEIEAEKRIDSFKLKEKIKNEQHIGMNSIKE